MSQINAELIDAIGKLGIEIVSIVSFAMTTIVLVWAFLKFTKGQETMNQNIDAQTKIFLQHVKESSEIKEAIKQNGAKLDHLTGKVNKLEFQKNTF